MPRPAQKAKQSHSICRLRSYYKHKLAMQILVDLGGNTEIVHISGNENSQSLAQMLAADVGPRLAPDEIVSLMTHSSSFITATLSLTAGYCKLPCKVFV